MTPQSRVFLPEGKKRRKCLTFGLLNAKGVIAMNVLTITLGLPLTAAEQKVVQAAINQAIAANLIDVPISYAWTAS
jgi:hypothetical protein